MTTNYKHPFRPMNDRHTTIFVFSCLQARYMLSARHMHFSFFDQIFDLRTISRHNVSHSGSEVFNCQVSLRTGIIQPDFINNSLRFPSQLTTKHGYQVDEIYKARVTDDWVMRPATMLPQHIFRIGLVVNVNVEMVASNRCFHCLASLHTAQISIPYGILDSQAPTSKPILVFCLRLYPSNDLLIV